MAENLQTVPVDYNPFGATAAPGNAPAPKAPASPVLNAEPVDYNPFGAITPPPGASGASDPSQFMQGLKSGGINLLALGASAAAAGAQAYGSDEWQKRLDATASALQTEAQKYAGKNPTIESIINDPDKLSAAVNWFTFNLAQGGATSVPIMLAALAGGLPAAAGSAYLMGVGDIRQSQLEGAPGKQPDLATEFLGAVPYAALEYIGAPLQFARSLTGAVGKESAQTFLRRLPKEMSKEAFGEFVNEYGQGGITDLAKGWAQGRDTKDILTDLSVQKDMLEQGAAGAVPGAVFGMGGAVRSPRPAPTGETQPTEPESAATTAAPGEGQGSPPPPPGPPPFTPGAPSAQFSGAVEAVPAAGYGAQDIRSPADLAVEGMGENPIVTPPPPAPPAEVTGTGGEGFDPSVLYRSQVERPQPPALPKPSTIYMEPYPGAEPLALPAPGSLVQVSIDGKPRGEATVTGYSKGKRPRVKLDGIEGIPAPFLDRVTMAPLPERTQPSLIEPNVPDLAGRVGAREEVGREEGQARYGEILSKVHDEIPNNGQTLNDARFMDDVVAEIEKERSVWTPDQHPNNTNPMNRYEYQAWDEALKIAKREAKAVADTAEKYKAARAQAQAEPQPSMKGQEVERIWGDVYAELDKMLAGVRPKLKDYEGRMVIERVRKAVLDAWKSGANEAYIRKAATDATPDFKKLSTSPKPPAAGQVGTPIGQNRYGDNLYEDQNGVRYTRGDGVKTFENVAVAPDGSRKPVGRLRDDKWLTEDEARTKAADQARAEVQQTEQPPETTVTAPPGYHVGPASAVKDKEEARIKGGQFTAIARRDAPWSVERGYGASPEEAQRNALAKVMKDAPAPAAVPPGPKPDPFFYSMQELTEYLSRKLPDGYLAGWAGGRQSPVEIYGPNGERVKSYAGRPERASVERTLKSLHEKASQTQAAPTSAPEPTSDGAPTKQETKRPEPDTIESAADQESSHGIQRPVPAEDVGERAPAAQEPAPRGGAERAPAGEKPGSARSSRPTAGERAEISERPTEESPGASPSGRDRQEPVDRVRDRSAVGEKPAAKPDAKADVKVTGENFIVEPGELAENRSQKQKALHNLKVIELVKKLEAEGRPATREEQADLAKYVGWGTIRPIFPDSQGNYAKGWEEIGARLKELLTDTEYRTASRSNQYAFYTSEAVIRSMWRAVERLGFNGGLVFEPGMGIGGFLMASPTDINIKYVGQELDHLTARVAQQLHPRAGIKQADFTRTPVPHDTYDLVIGNPPFADVVIKSDPDYAADNLMLHDYFFVKSLDAVRPGGILAYITSAGTMNKVADDARKKMAERADFVGGVRLPSSAFSTNANTEVTTDILFFRKKIPGEVFDQAVDVEQWTQTENVTLPDDSGAKVKGAVSSYFAAHPEMVLGEQGFFGDLWAGRYGVRRAAGDKQALSDKIIAAVENLPSDIMADWQSPADRAEMDFTATEKKPGSFYIGDDGRLMQTNHRGTGIPIRQKDVGVEGGYSAAAIERIKAMIPVRDALRATYAAYLNPGAGNEATARGRLNAAYDAFVEKFGPINKANYSYRRPSSIQEEAARSRAREEARELGTPFYEGTFDPAVEVPGGNIQEIARARKAAREKAAAEKRAWDEGSFNPDDMPDIVIERRPNIDPFMDDPESYRLRSIEHYDDATDTAAKGPVFFENIISREKPPEITSPEDALLWSLNEFGSVNIPKMAEKLDLGESSVIQALHEHLFEDPDAPGRYVTKDEYLSGNVVKKLKIAQAAAARDVSFARNVDALKAAQPDPIPPAQVSMTLGMSWIPEEMIENFAVDGLGLSNFTVKYYPKLASWQAYGDDESAAATVTYGTPYRSAPRLIQDALNKAQPRIYTEGDTPGSKVLDTVATQAAQDKVQQIKDRFESWVKEDGARAESLANIYNEKFNVWRTREYTGEYLTTPGVSSAWSWRPHQRRVIARIIQSGNTYMAHAVGAGKTSAMIGAGMEMRRLGLVRKPMYVVPNHMLGQFAKEFYEQYPTARIAVADDRRFHTSRRKQFVANVSQEDLDAVIIPHSSFGMIQISDEFEQRYVNDLIDDYRDAIADMDKQEDRIAIRRLENKIEKLEQRLLGMRGRRKDKTLTFEEMGVDFLFIDEAHMFRKLAFATTQGNLKGISSDGSQMAWDLFVKTRYLETVAPGRNLVLASGTPITNTMGELYTVQRYIQPNVLEENGVSKFDAWAATFGDTKAILEKTASGRHEYVTRFARFVNIPELSQMVRQNMDLVLPSELAKYVRLPAIKGGERKLHMAPSTDALIQFQEELARRVDAIKARRGPPKKGDDILLSVINDGRHAATDLRYVREDIGDSEPSKLKMLADNVFDIWNRTKKTVFYDPASDYKKKVDAGPATQIIFSDLGVNPRVPANSKTGYSFSGYRWLVSELKRRGVPRNQIAIIGDYKTPLARQKLFNDINDGKVRILIGSSKKMGTGMNIQKRLVAEHNLDPLWYPADDEQRVGRILRQGNMNSEIEIHDYSTEDSYDAAMWKMMATKGRFIEGFLRGDETLREISDVGEASTYEQAAAMAVSDKRVLELAEKTEAFERMSRRRAAHQTAQYSIKTRIANAKNSLKYEKSVIADLENAIKERKDTAGDKFFAVVAGKTITKRVDAGEAMIEIMRPVVDAGKSAAGKPKLLAHVGGFPVEFETSTRKDTNGDEIVSVHGTITLSDGRWLNFTPNMGSAAGTVSSIEKSIASIDDHLARAKADLKEAQATIKDLTPKLGNDFEGEAEFQSLQREVRDLERELADEGKPDEHPADGTMSEGTKESRFGTTAPPFFSALTRSVDELKQSKAPAAQWVGAIKNLTTKGVKQEEIDWSGVVDWLGEHDRPVTKDELLGFLRANEVKVEEVEKGGSRVDTEADRKRLYEFIQSFILDGDMSPDEAGRLYSGALAGDSQAIGDIEGLGVSDEVIAPFRDLGRSPTKFASYTLPGGENYRELLLTLPPTEGGRFDPSKVRIERKRRSKTQGTVTLYYDGKKLETYEDPIELNEKSGQYENTRSDESWIESAKKLFEKGSWDQTVKPLSSDFRGGHYDEPNVLAHVRFNERTDAEGKRVLFIEEIQSDWHQKGRKKGYSSPNSLTAKETELRRLNDRTWGNAPLTTQEQMRLSQLRSEGVNQSLKAKLSGVPDAPFKRTWPELAFKRMVRYAAENGFDKVAWTTGEQQADRYDLSKQVEAIVAEKHENLISGRDVFSIRGVLHANRSEDLGTYASESLDGVVGKDLAEKIRRDVTEYGVEGRERYEGVDLKVGGEGMRGFYDKMLPAFAAKFGKKFGAKVGQASIVKYVEDNGNIWDEPVHSLDITPQMREAALKGLPLFDRYGAPKIPRTDQAKIAQRIKTIVRQMAPAANLEIVDRLFDAKGGEIAGRMAAARQLISVSLNYADAEVTARHEVVHFLREAGLFTDAEWSALETKARRGWSAKYDVAGKYPDLDRAAQNEEAIAQAFAEWKGGRAKIEPRFRRLFARIRDFFQRVANTLRGLGYKTVDDIFAKVESGEVGRRQGGVRTGAGEKYAAASRKTIDQRSLGQNATWIAQIMGATKTGQGRDYGKGRSRYFSLPDGRELRVSDHQSPRDYGGGTADINVVFNDEDMTDVTIVENDVELATIKGEKSWHSFNMYRKELHPSEPTESFSVFNNDAEAYTNAVASYLRKIAGTEKHSVFGMARGPVSVADVEREAPGAYQRHANRVLDAISNRFGYMVSPLGSLPGKRKYLAMRYKALGNVGKTQDLARTLYHTFRAATPEDSKAIYEYLTTADAKPTAIANAELRGQAIEAKKTIDNVGKLLVERGLLSQESYEKYQDQYLPRVYLKYLLPQDVIARIGGGKKVSDLGYLKERKDIPEDIRKLILGEVHDPAFLVSTAVGKPLRDVAILDFLGQIARTEEWVFPKSIVEWEGRPVSVRWLSKEASRIRKMADYLDTEADKAAARDIAKRMDAVADPALDDLGKIPDDYKEVPDTARYGQMGGMAVRKEIYDDMVGSVKFLGEGDSIAERVLGYGGVLTKATQLWKMSKVSLNPPTQIRNFISNAMLLHMSGVPMWKIVPVLTRAVNEMRTNGKHWQVAKDYGVTRASFAANELMEIREDLLDLETRSGNPISHLKHLAGKIAIKAGDMYQFSESLFKTAKIIDAMDRGMSAEDAALEAHKALFDYSLIPPSVRYLRNAPIGIPFMTFYFKALPFMLETVVKRPTKMIPYIAAPILLAQWIASSYDVDDDDLDKLKKALPDWLQRRGNAYLLPYKDQHGRWQAIDIGYFFPWSMYQELANDIGSGNVGGIVQTTGLLGGPVPDLISAIKTGRDPFTNRDIVNSADPPEKQTADIMQYLWRMSAPTWVTDIGFANHMYRALTGKVDPKTGDPKLTETQALLRLFGLNVYPMEPEKTRAKNIRWMKYEISEVKQRMKEQLRDRNLDAEDREDIRKTYGERIRKKQQELRDYAAESTIPRNLRTGAVPPVTGRIIDRIMSDPAARERLQQSQ